ncbi:hypothetical protein JCM10213_004684 [Rhodosporidiobolus nylandii]
MKNYAAWLKAPREKLEVEESPLEQPNEGEVLVKVHAVAVAPIDYKQQDEGLFVPYYPWIMGCDVSGVVISVGTGVENVKEGDRVLGYPHARATSQIKHSSFQHYVVLHSSAISPIPVGLSFEEATVLPLAVSTAATGLYQKSFLGLPLPKSDAPNPEGKGKSLLVCGGSSSVGSAAIQLALASGLRVVATASPANFDSVKSLGASAVVDYKSEKVVDELVAELKKGGEEFAGVFDAIAENGTVEKSAEVASQLGGKKFVAATLPPPANLPGGVVAKFLFATDMVDKDNAALAKAIFHDFVPAALTTGALKALPEPLLVGKGLESIQKGVDVLRQGVSARKVVVSVA